MGSIANGRSWDENPYKVFEPRDSYYLDWEELLEGVDLRMEEYTLEPNKMM